MVDEIIKKKNEYAIVLLLFGLTNKDKLIFMKKEN